MKHNSWMYAATAVIGALLLIGLLLPSGTAGSGREAGRMATSKDMVFWLHWDPTSPTVNGKATQLTFNTTQYWTKTNYTIDGNKDLGMDFYMVPALASDLSINGTVTLGFWGNYSGSNNNFQLQTIIYELNSTGNENWTSSTYSDNYSPASSPQYYSFQYSDFQHIFAAGSTIRINIQITGGSGIYKAIYVDTGTNNSRIVFPCENYMDVTAIDTFDWQGNPQTGFQSNANNTTVIMRSTVTDPFGGYDIRWANLTLVGPAGNTVLDNVSMAKVGGTPVSFSNTYEEAFNYTGMAPGRYNITVWAVDNNGYYYCFYFMNYDYGSYLVSNTSFFFIGTPRFVNVLTVDSTGVPLDGAEVQTTLVGEIIDHNLTNGTGYTNLSMQPGPYRFRVMWQGMKVLDEPVNVTDNVSDTDPLVLRCSVFYPGFLAVDSQGVPLVDAAVYLHYPNGTASILPFHTDGTGVFNLTQVAGGPYELSVVWGGVEVKRTIVLVDGNITYEIGCDVFYLTIQAVDPHGAPVQNAQTVITANITGIVADSRLTDLNGTAVFRLPRQFYDMTIYWYESVVFRGYAEPLLDRDKVLDVTCWIYYLTVQSVDSAGASVENALTVVSISSNSKVMDSKLSSADGKVQIRAPAGFYNVTVSWQDLPVFQGTFVEVLEDSTFIAHCQIFYLNVTVVDAKGVPVENAQVQVFSVLTGKLLDARSSNSFGNLTSRLPAADIRIVARWQDVIVNSTTSYLLTGDGSLVLHCSIFYLTVEALDSRGVPIQAAQIKIGFAGGGKLLDVQTTDGAGRSVSRLPAADLSIQAFWQDVLINDTLSYVLIGDINGDARLTLDCRVYYLDVLALDSRGIQLEYASVQVDLAGGRQIETRLSDEAGMVTVRVPVGEVNVTVTWSDVVVGVTTGQLVNSSQLLTIQCSVFYLETTITDTQDVAVSNAQVSFVRNASGRLMSVLTTGPHGNATFRLPAEKYDITVVWQDQLVSPETRFQLARDGALTVRCMIYYLTIKPVDSQGKLLENATVVIRQELTGNILDTRVTGADGAVTTRLPTGFHTLIISWKDVEVNTTSYYELNADVTLTIPCRVFYLTVNPLDDAGVSLADAEVLVFPDGRPDLPSSLTTNATGKVVFRLPTQGYELRISWRNVEVCTRTGYPLAGDAFLQLKCKVYYLTVRVFDRDGKGLEGVQLTVYNMVGRLAGDVFDSTATNSSSRAVFRLPIGNYMVIARYKTTYLLTPVDMSESKAVDLQGSMSVKLTFEGYPIPVYTTNAFYFAMLVVLLVIVAGAAVYYVYRKFGKKPLALAGTGGEIRDDHSGAGAEPVGSPGERKQEGPGEDNEEGKESTTEKKEGAVEEEKIKTAEKEDEEPAPVNEDKEPAKKGIPEAQKEIPKTAEVPLNVGQPPAQPKPELGHKEGKIEGNCCKSG